MKILSVDTSSSVCAVALLEDEELINQKILDNGKTHSENFMSLLDETLKETNISPKLSALSLMAKEITTFNQREIVNILKENGALQLQSFAADDIRRK